MKPTDDTERSSAGGAERGAAPARVEAGSQDLISGPVDADDEDPFSDLITVKEAARLLRLSASTLNQYRCDGRGPVYRKHGGRVFYSRRSLLRWSQRHRYLSTSHRIGSRR
ncbi:helix-turn-helix domain-containing protein [Glycocaulis profundi]|jgi:hypothetical protein|nr:helix-turn-helix domain-containing protein [Glycocaulis profundi]